MRKLVLIVTFYTAAVLTQRSSEESARYYASVYDNGYRAGYEQRQLAHPSGNPFVLPWNSDLESSFSPENSFSPEQIIDAFPKELVNPLPKRPDIPTEEIRWDHPPPKESFGQEDVTPWDHVFRLVRSEQLLPNQLYHKQEKSDLLMVADPVPFDEPVGPLDKGQLLLMEEIKADGTKSFFIVEPIKMPSGEIKYEQKSEVIMDEGASTELLPDQVLKLEVRREIAEEKKDEITTVDVDRFWGREQLHNIEQIFRKLGGAFEISKPHNRLTRHQTEFEKPFKIPEERFKNKPLLPSGISFLNGAPVRDAGHEKLAFLLEGGNGPNGQKVFFLLESLEDANGMYSSPALDFSVERPSLKLKANGRQGLRGQLGNILLNPQVRDTQNSQELVINPLAFHAPAAGSDLLSRYRHGAVNFRALQDQPGDPQEQKPSLLAQQPHQQLKLNDPKISREEAQLPNLLELLLDQPRRLPPLTLHESVRHQTGRVLRLLWRASPQTQLKERSHVPSVFTNEKECDFDAKKCWTVQSDTTLSNAVMYDRVTGITCKQCLELCILEPDIGPYVCKSAVYDHLWKTCDLFAVEADSNHWTEQYSGRDYFKPTGVCSAKAFLNDDHAPEVFLESKMKQ